MPRVDHSARLEFGHALAQWGADRAGARVLHIKGLPAHLVLPVGRLTSVDVDVLIDAGGHAATVTQLLASPTVKINSDGTFCAEGHAVEVISEGLGVALDVHAHFPGCRVPASEVFEALWVDSREVALGGWSCRIPGRVGTAFVSVVHAARNPVEGRAHARAIAHWSALTEEEQRAFDGLVGRLAAEAAARVVLGGYETADRVETAKLRAYQSAARPTTLWLLTFLAEPTIRGRVEVVRRAVRSRFRTVRAQTPHYEGVGGKRARVARALGSLRPALRETVSLLKAGT